MDPRTPSTSALPPRGAGDFPLAAVLFFLSGALGLGYELVWIRKAALVVGASQLALSTVLAAFFVGLGAGSHVVGRRLRTRRWSPLFVYGLFEAGIGLFALFFPALFEGLEKAYGVLYPFASGSAAMLFVLRFALLFVLFLPPTFLMGGTLPLLLDGLVERDRDAGPRTSLLYGINVLGAVAGVLLTSYLSIPRLGLNGTSVLGGAAHLAIGALACLAFRRAPVLHAPVLHGSVERGAVEGTLPGLFPAAAFASGLLALAYQVAWARYFSLFQMSTVYLTAMLLAVYLLGLAAGSFVLAPLLVARLPPLAVLAWAQALAPLAAFTTLEWWQAAEYRYAIQGTISDGVVVPDPTLAIDPSFVQHWRFSREALDGILFAPLFQVALVVFLPALLIGVGLPALIAGAAGRAESLRAVSGRLVFWNTLGAAAGSFLSGYALLPLLGLHWTLASLGLGSLGLAVLARVASRERGATDQALTRQERRHGSTRPRQRPFFWIAATLVLAALGAHALSREDVSRRAILRHGVGREIGAGQQDISGRPAVELVEMREGPLDTSYVFEDARSLRIGSGGVSLGIAYKDAPSAQAIQGHLPCLFYPGSGAPEDCLGICLGTGQSFGALLLHPIRRLDVVEISGDILDLALRRFEPYHHGLDRDPRVRFHLDDGRHFIERSLPASYDVISLEPPPPTADGVHSLYSLEFYRGAARVLRPGGVLMQWVPLHTLTPRDVQGVLKTQAEAFPFTFVVKVSERECMALSYPARPRFLRAAIEERAGILARERFLAGMRWHESCRHELPSLEGVLSLLLMGPDGVRELPSPAIYRDDTQLLSYSSGDRWLFRRYQGEILAGISFPALRLTGFAELGEFIDPPLDAAMVEELEAERAASLSRFHVPAPARLKALEEARLRAATPAGRQSLCLELAESHDRPLWKDEAFSWVEKAVREDPAGGSPEDLRRVREIARHGLAVHREPTARWVSKMEAAYPGSPLVQAMRRALAEFEERERARMSGYLFW